MKGMKRGMSLLLSAVLAGTMLVSPLSFATETVVADSITPKMPAEAKEGYTLKWQDEFDGTSLNRADWNVELHEPGWVNSELQAYVDSEENIKVEDGNLIIQPKKDGDSYTSGRVNTQGKHDFTYGVFEVRAKVPAGQGYLPAFWMMPTDENLYGQWPRCGEIDCMEVMGQSLETVYGTVHYGNPHGQKQGTASISNAAEDYHTYTCEWEPGKITWYVDGSKYYETSDWHSTTVGQGTVAYPAPFDQPFYMILNLAIGGSWVGYPDDTTTYDDQSFAIDYVRVWQKDDYNEEVEKPADATIKTPDAEGNYITNGNFADAEALDDETDWRFLTAQGGEGSASIANNTMTIDTVSAGNVDYSVQLVQAGLPLEKNDTYQITFEAKASADRITNFAVKAPDRDWKAYVSENIELTTEYQTYSFEYTMKDATDPNARLEFNMGKAGSTASIYIKNVKVVKSDDADSNAEDAKTVLTDGNYIYNGSFQQGTGRTEYWSFSDDMTKLVTSLSDGRRLKAEAFAGSYMTQDAIAVAPYSTYALSFDAEAFEGAAIDVTVAGVTKTFDLSADKKTYNDTITLPETLDNRDVKITFKNEGVYLLDNIRLVEDSLIKNGTFNAGTAGFEVYVDSSAEASCVVDSIKEDNAADFTIKNTGDQDWKIQLKQGNVLLKKDQYYKLTFDIKSSIDRQFVYAIQRNGATHNDDWTPYVQETVALTAYGDSGEYTHIEKYFKMKEDTDSDSIFNIALGGGSNTTQHRVCIDNIELVTVDASEVPGEGQTVKPNTNLLKNADFADGLEGWTETIANWGGEYVADASSATADGAITYTINNPGTADWHVQLKQSGVKLEAGETYKASYKVNSTTARQIKSGIMSTSYNWYGGVDPEIPANETVEITYEFTMSEADDAADFYISLGGIPEADTPAGVITISDISLIKVGDEEPATENILVNADFASGLDSWTETIANWGGEYVADASSATADGTITYTINNPGTEDWHIQLKQSGVKLESGETYKASYKINSTTARQIKSGVMSTSYNWYGGVDPEIPANETVEITYEFTMSEADDAADFYISLGGIPGTDTPAGVITISDISLVKAGTEVETPDEPETPVEPEEPEEPKHEHSLENVLEPASFGKDGLVGEECACGYSNVSVIKAIDTVSVKSSVTYTGKALSPAVTVEDSEGNVIDSKYYTVTYDKNVKIGTGKATITFKDLYTGKVTRTFRIIPKGTSFSKIDSEKKVIKLKWNKQTTQTTGYIIQCSTDKNFKKGVKTRFTIFNKDTTVNFTGLKEGTTYYVRVCTYKLVGLSVYQSDWSAVETIKTESPKNKANDKAKTNNKNKK